jgi:hypothetical protein
MIKSNSKAATLSLSLLLVAISCAESSAQNGGGRRRPPQGQDTVLFDLTSYGNDRIIVPVVIIRGGRFVAPPSFGPKSAKRRFAATYYRLGQKYRVLGGGSEAGTVTVKNLKTCDPALANVEVQPTAEAGGRAIATNSDSLGKKLVKRRDLNETEKAAIMKLVEPSFRRAGVGVPEFEGVVNGATAADLDGDGKAELIGTFATGAKVQHTVFIIAEPQGNGFKPGLLLFNAALDEYGDNSVRRDFLEVLDLDDDGIAEVVVWVNDYRRPDELYFVIYKKQRGRWRGVYSGGGMRCVDEGGDH